MVLGGQHTEEKHEAQQGKRGIPVHRAHRHRTCVDDFDDIEVEDEEQQPVDGKKEIEEYLLCGGRKFIGILCLWECAEEGAKPPNAVRSQTDEKVGGLHEPFVLARKDQLPKGGDADGQSKKEEEPRPEGEAR